MKRCARCDMLFQGKGRLCGDCLSTSQAAHPSAQAGEERCASCGAILPSGGKQCLICGLAAGETPLHPYQPKRFAEEGQMTVTGRIPRLKKKGDSPAYARRKYRTMFRTALLMILVLVLSTAGVWGWDNVPYLLSSDKVRADNAILYVRRDGALRLKSALADAPRTITPEFSARGETDWDSVALASRNGRYLAFLDYCRTGKGGEGIAGELYLVDLAGLTRREDKPAEGNRIAQGVTGDFLFSAEDDYLIFVTETGLLYATDYQEVWLLDEGVDALLDAGSRQVLYSKQSAGGSGIEVFVRDLDWETGRYFRVDGGISELLDWTPELDRFLYLQPRSGDAGIDLYDVGAYDRVQNQRVILATGVYRVLEGSAVDTSLLYLVPQELNLEYGDFVEDDLAEADEAIQEPDIADYPQYVEYLEAYEEDPPSLVEIVAEYGDEEPEWFGAWEEMSFYQLELEEYEKKLERDTMRRQIQREVDARARWEIQLYQLMLRRGPQEEILAWDIISANSQTGPVVEGNLESGVVVYGAGNPQELEPQLFSQIAESQQPYSAEDWLNKQLTLRFWYLLPGRESGLLYQPEQRSAVVRDIAVTKQPDSIYLLVQEQGWSQALTLLYSAVGLEEAETAYPVDREVQHTLGEETLWGGFLYYKEAGGGVCSLYSMQEGERTHIGYDVAQYAKIQVVNRGRSLLFFENYDVDGQAGDLYLVNKQKRLIASDTSEFYYRGDNLIYLLRNMGDGGGELYSYSDGVLTLIDSGVTHVLPMTE